MCYAYLPEVSGCVIRNIFFDGFLKASMIRLFCKKQIMCGSRASNFHKNLIAFGPSFCSFVSQIRIAFRWIKCPKTNKPLKNNKQIINFISIFVCCGFNYEI
ncbi:hypothetical protein HanPI659440_Chr05g0199421 [Helianthus annuus]|nr:hypothetical protein HanPI659440_Chr05g0199421 [Helianthus annuus]